MRKHVWWLAVVLTVGLVGAPASSAYEPRAGGTFNMPRPWGTEAARYRIILEVEAAINRAQGPTKRYPDPSITVSTFLLDRARSVDALIAACKRGISVRVILDEDIENANSRRLIRALNADNVRDADRDGKPDHKPRSGRCGRDLRNREVSGRETLGGSDRLITVREARISLRAPTGNIVTWGRDGSYVKRCQGSCRGPGGNVHTKFYLFSRTGTAHHVVMVSSSNLNRGGANLGWNDLVVMNNRPKSFEVYQKVHRLMTQERRAGARPIVVQDGRYLSRFFPMRNATKRTDPTMRDLRSIRCRGPMGATTIHVSMFYWAGPRGHYILDKLLGLARQGCKLAVIYGAPGTEIAARLRTAARAGRVALYDSRWDFDEDGWNEVRTHAKYVLVRGATRTHARTHQVWTGSQNWVRGSLSKGDESTVNLTHKRTYQQYLANWNTIRLHSRRIGGPATTTAARTIL